ncbi:MAG TPA: HIT family protein, partial [Syntrophales bacterium]|nr:HIT family protein [Syntrophales bacterium]
EARFCDFHFDPSPYACPAAVALDKLSVQEHKHFFGTLMKAHASLDRYLESFRALLGANIERVLGIRMAPAEWKLEVTPPARPDISIGQVFLFHFDLLWFLIPMAVFRGHFERHFIRQLARQDYVNTSCLLDIHPNTQGHCLVISKRHVPWWHELTDAETTSLFRLARTMAHRMMERLEPDFVFLYARGRRIPHTHLFLIPTYSGDVLDRFFNALENFQESPATLARIREPAVMQAAADLLRED